MAFSYCVPAYRHTNMLDTAACCHVPSPTSAPHSSPSSSPPSASLQLPLPSTSSSTCSSYSAASTRWTGPTTSGTFSTYTTSSLSRSLSQQCTLTRWSCNSFKTRLINHIFLKVMVSLLRPLMAGTFPRMRGMLNFQMFVGWDLKLSKVSWVQPCQATRITCFWKQVGRGPWLVVLVANQ